MTATRPVEFPVPTGANVNMMPIIMGDHATVPNELRRYCPLIDACDLRPGSTVYLSISEGECFGATQRRPGVHTEGTSLLGWGGGAWGSSGIGLGIYMASTDGSCRWWNTQVDANNAHGHIPRPDGRGHRMRPSTLVHIGDRTPHEALASTGYRQWFRLVGDAVGGWWERHSTANRMVRPNAPIITGNKFDSHDPPAVSE